MGEINEMAMNSVLKAYYDGHLPSSVIMLDKISLENLGYDEISEDTTIGQIGDVSNVPKWVYSDLRFWTMSNIQNANKVLLVWNRLTPTYTYPTIQATVRPVINITKTSNRILKG